MDIKSKLVKFKTQIFPMPFGTNNRIKLFRDRNKEFARLSLSDGKLVFIMPKKEETIYGLNLRVYMLGLLKIIFLDEEYKHINVKSKEIVDIGASMADTAIYFIKRGATKVYGFEILDRFIELGQENIKLNAKELGYLDKEPKIILTKSGSPLQEIIKTFKVKKGSILKMDCDGCEYKMLAETNKKTLKHFSSIILEYHNGYSQIQNQFEEAGFKIELGTKYTEKAGLLYAKQ